MHKKEIKLNSNTPVDLKKLIVSRLLIQANSGGGKSWLLRRLLEQSHGKVQQIIIDLEGEFSTLREKYDYILAGKGGDLPAETKSAALLARKCLEHQFSLIVDLSEMPQHLRRHFVRLFLDAMIDAPKDLWNRGNGVLVVIDEAHFFVPEKGQSEAASSVIDLCTRGRKRGFCAVLATQRLSKLHKDAAAECNNKLVGRTGLDIDMKRAAEELGFTTKEQYMSLRHLDPGEFFAFGPALSKEVSRITVGDVQTSHPTVGTRNKIKAVAPTDKIKSILKKLADLPAEAEKEAKTVADMQLEIRQLKAQLRNNPQKIVQNDPKQVEKALFSRDKEWDKLVGEWKTYTKRLENIIKDSIETMGYFTKISKIPNDKPLFIMTPSNVKTYIPTTEQKKDFEKLRSEFSFLPTQKGKSNIIERHLNPEKPFGKCSRAIYTYLVDNIDSGPKTKTQVAVAVGYSQNSGGFNNSISELSAAGLIAREANGLEVRGELNHGLVIPIDTSLEKWSSKLGACARKIWEVLLDHMNTAGVAEQIPLNDIAEMTEYSVTSGGFNNSVSELSALGLIERMPGRSIRINPEILDL